MPSICLALQVFVILIFVRIILSWFPASEGLFMTVQRFAFAATEWAMGPLRRASRRSASVPLRSTCRR